MKVRYISIVLLISFLIPTSFVGQNIDPKKLDSYLDNLKPEGLSVLVGLDGKVVYQKSYGFANRPHQVPNSDETKFQIGSITKQFTAMGIMILHDRKLLSTEDPLSKHLNNIPEIWKTLTIHQLLTHTSGLMHSWEHPKFREIMSAKMSLDQIIEYFKDQPLKVPTGSQWRYSGLGYFILAKIIEEHSNQSWPEFVKTEIFDKLGMKNSGASNPGKVVSNLASGYTNMGSEIVQAAYIHLPVLTGGGDLYSTAEDLFIWHQALLDGKLISKNAYAKMFKAEKNNYAYGWFVDEHQGLKRTHHSGGVPGFIANIARYPENDLVVIILSNVDGQGGGRILGDFTNLVLTEYKN